MQKIHHSIIDINDNHKFHLSINDMVQMNDDAEKNNGQQNKQLHQLS